MVYDSLVWGTVSGGVNIEASGVLACDDTYPLVVYDPASGLVRVKKDYVLDYTSALKNVIMDGSTRYTYGLNKVSSSKKVYYNHDRLGSVDYTTDTAGVVVSHVTYDDWGLPTGDLTIAEYTGHPFDKVLNLYYAKARMYSAEDRRFVSVDPARDGLNWYMYGADNPIGNVDPNGLSAIYFAQFGCGGSDNSDILTNEKGSILGRGDGNSSENWNLSNVVDRASNKTYNVSYTIRFAKGFVQFTINVKYKVNSKGKVSEILSKSQTNKSWIPGLNIRKEGVQAGVDKSSNVAWVEGQFTVYTTISIVVVSWDFEAGSYFLYCEGNKNGKRINASWWES